MAIEVATARRLFTREEYRRMGEVGILKPTDRVELIRGENHHDVADWPPSRGIRQQSERIADHEAGWPRHRLGSKSRRAVGRFRPQPDLAVWRRRSVPYKEREAYAEDTLLLVEVAETSLTYDRTTKLRLYAETGISEYWVVNCIDESVEIYRTPTPAGYRDVSRVSGRDAVSLQAFPDLALTLAEIFA